jgi:hypothetical protein
VAYKKIFPCQKNLACQKNLTPEKIFQNGKMKNGKFVSLTQDT